MGIMYGCRCGYVCSLVCGLGYNLEEMWGYLHILVWGMFGSMVQWCNVGLIQDEVCDMVWSMVQGMIWDMV